MSVQWLIVRLARISALSPDPQLYAREGVAPDPQLYAREGVAPGRLHSYNLTSFPVNSDWYEGRCKGMAGIFPKSYVKAV